MSGAGKRPVARRLTLALAAALIAAAVLGGGLAADRHASARLTSAVESRPAAPALRPRRAQPPDRASVATSASSPTCGPESASTIASVDHTVANGIYAAEISSPEVYADIGHITGSQALLGALASNNTAAVYEAVHSIVYMPGWHIVRLRVVKAGRVVADVGGPDIIAPVSGRLRSKGRTLATFVMSVQDDLGYVKLVSRFIGVPIDLYRGGSFVMGTLQPAPSTVSAGATVHVRGTSYFVEQLDARAFPSGTLHVALFIHEPSRAVSAESCAAVRLSAWGSVAMHIAARFQPLQSSYQSFVDVLHGTTGGPVYVRAGSTRIAGGAAPARLPRHGTVRFAGRSWAIFSWEPVPPARIYFLTPLS
jgi:hypothetical protein